MADQTLISWADKTHNHWIGCSRVSPACDGCYAAHLMETRLGRVEWGGPGKGNGTRSLTSEANRRKPISWNKQAERDGTRPFVFCSSLADVFDNQVPVEWRLDLFELIKATPNLVWLLLTKRPQNIVKMVKAIGFMPSNIAFGATVEDRQRVETNLPHLIVAAGLRPLFLFASCEPLLGDLGDLSPWMNGDPCPQRLADGEYYDTGVKIGSDGWPKLPAIGWWISGGETDQGGHKARPTHPTWFRSLRDQCASAGVAYHHKQNGEWMPTGEWYADHPVSLPLRMWRDGAWTDDGGVEGEWMAKVGKNKSGRMLDGVTHDAFPEVR